LLVAGYWLTFGFALPDAGYRFPTPFSLFFKSDIGHLLSATEERSDELGVANHLP
jgi:hypothetical protein